MPKYEYRILRITNPQEDFGPLDDGWEPIQFYGVGDYNWETMVKHYVILRLEIK